METIIEEQEKEFKEIYETWKKEPGAVNFADVELLSTRYKSWHKEKVKQILQALVDREEGFRKGHYHPKWNQSKNHTIFYLQEQIKKL